MTELMPKENEFDPEYIKMKEELGEPISEHIKLVLQNQAIEEEDGVLTPASQFINKKGGLNKEELMQQILMDIDIKNGANDSLIWYYHKNKNRDGESTGVWRPANNYSNDIIGRATVDILGNSYSISRSNEMKSYIRQKTSKLDVKPDPNLINFANGIYEISSEKFLPHSPSFKSVNQAPHNYDSTMACDYFDEKLADWLPDPKDQERAYQLIAYLMMPANPLQRLFMLYGPGGTGKSTFIKLIQAMIGKENYTAQQVQYLFNPNNRFATASLYGKQLNVVSDMQVKHLRDTSILKQLAGEDLIGAEIKGGAHFTFENYCKMLIATNEIPTSSDVSTAYFRRFELFLFNEVQSGHIDQTRLHAEIPGIFNKVIPYLKPLLKSKQFTESKNSKELKAQFRRESDQVSVFIEECDALEEVASSLIPKAEVWNLYRDWCEKNGFNSGTSITFSKRMLALGFGLDRDNERHSIEGQQQRCFIGLKNKSKG